MCSEPTGQPPESRLGSQPGVMDRRNFLRLGGAGLAAVALLGPVGTVFAKGEPSAGSSSLVAEFKEAAREYGVPTEVLMAVGYVNTRWEMPPPWANAYAEGDLHGWGSYGIMALVQNPFSDTLGEASRLTGISEEQLKTDRGANIRGGAALLAESLGRYRPETPKGYSGAIAGRGMAPAKNYAAVAGIGSGELYAEQVLAALETGASLTIKSGERLSLPGVTPGSRVGGGS